jgi:beta-glucosidase
MPHDVTPYEGILKAASNSIEVVLHDGESDPAALAKTCDAAVVFVTIVESEGMDRNCTDLPILKGSVGNEGRHSGDGVNIIVNTYTLGETVKGDQEALIKAIAATKVPTIVVLVAGSPVTMTKWEKDAAAILLPWHGGEQGGVAVAEALFGKINPGGKLPITFPRNQGQIPIYYNYPPSGRGYDYWDDDGKPQYPFGYGLSYTTFVYSDLTLSKTEYAAGENAVVSSKVKNSGKVTGDEVAQLYIHDSISSVTKPLKELKGFKRVTLQPDEVKEITLTLTSEQLSMWNLDMKWVEEPGEFEIMIGSSSDDIRLTAKFMVV